MPSFLFSRPRLSPGPLKAPGLALVFFLICSGAAAKADVETIVCMRHGEKTPTELGQLRVRGLNRALALPDVLISKFGNPQFIFAPDPARKLVGGRNGQPFYYYVRPLATIEPTAVKCGLPVNTAFGYTEIAGLEKELLRPDYRNAVVFVAWEHNWEMKFAAKLVADLGGQAAEVPEWPSEDYDSLYVIRIAREGGKVSVSFAHDQEGLNGMSDQLPRAIPAAVSTK